LASRIFRRFTAVFGFHPMTMRQAKDDSQVTFAP
jgi:hypothetical protein